MSEWTPRHGWGPWQRPVAALWDEPLSPALRLGRSSRSLLLLAALVCLLVVQGMAIAHSLLWAAPLVCLLFVAVAVDVPLVPFVGIVLLARVLTDDLASEASRYSSSLNPSGLIAGLFILVAVGLLARRGRGFSATAAVVLWLGIWTAIAVFSNGASTVTIREGVRELSVVALAVIVCNSRGKLNVSVVTRLVQVAGLLSALVALYQLGTHSGATVGGFDRAYGTFAHPNDAAVYFAIAAMVSLWRYIDNGRGWLDLGFLGLYSVALISTFSIGGFLSLATMIGAFALFRSGSVRLRFAVCAVLALFIVAFVATPLGSERLKSETLSEQRAVGEPPGSSSSSLEWRLHKWETLIPEWEEAPLLGRGLGTKVAEEAPSARTSTSTLPHSEYVRYLVETGAVGVALLLAGVVVLLRRFKRQRQFSASRNVGTLGAALVIGLLVNAIAANTLLYTPAAYAAALVVAAVLCSPGWANGSPRPVGANGVGR